MYHIIRCFLSKDCNLLTQAFITYVRPLLEYCSPVWSPGYVTLINKIESVQRFFTKRLNGLQSISFDDRLAMLGLERLELRCLRFDLLMCYKIIYNYVNINTDCFLHLLPILALEVILLKLALPDSRINARSHSFAVRIIPLWNSLPNDVVNLSQLQIYTCLNRLSKTN